MGGSGEGAGSRGAEPSAGTGRSSSCQISNISSQIVLVGAAAGTVGPFVNAFCTELGRRLGGTLADWVSRVHADVREGTLGRVDLSVPGRVDLRVQIGGDSVSTTIDLDGSRDEAIAAHAADLVSQQVRERGLKWDGASGTWAPPT